MLYDKKWERTGLQDYQLILLEAADLLEEKGWCQFRYRNGQGQMCIAGAIGSAFDDRLASDDSEIGTKAYRALYRVIGETSFSMWNDAKGRTKEEVVQALRKAARAE